MDREAYWAAVHGVTEYSVHVTKYHRVGRGNNKNVSSPSSGDQSLRLRFCLEAVRGELLQASLLGM